MTNELQCVDCEHNDSCLTYQIIENTLDTNKTHYKLSLKLDFIFTVNKPEEFKAEFEDIAEDIGEEAASLSGYVKQLISECDCEVQPMGAELNIGAIPNKLAFEELSNYVKVTHETSND